MRNVIVVGGGAAGMAAAYAAGKNKHRVTLLEKNEKLGKKLYITGKGRCNITNAGDMEDLFAHVVTNSKFLYSAFYGFTNQDMMDLLEKYGLRLKVERGNRVFPESDKSSDVIKTLAAALKDAGVAVRLQTEVRDLIIRDGRCAGVLLSDGEKLDADAVILAAGGLSYPSTGSTGDGYRMAKTAGHEVTDLHPGLVPFLSSESWIGELQGLSLRNVTVTLWDGKKKLYQEMGEMLFTHFGVSGPAILSASSLAAKRLKKGPLMLGIDLKPALSHQQLDERILRDFEASKNRQFKNALDKLYPARLIPVMIRRSGIPEDKKVNEITREERGRLGALTKNFTVELTGLRGFNEAIITQGGVRVKEINPSTMESRLLPGLYMAGEMLDLDAYTGGYNLQIAWSTGWTAGSSI